jgi:hypothetical protein
MVVPGSGMLAVLLDIECSGGSGVASPIAALLLRGVNQGAASTRENLLVNVWSAHQTSKSTPLAWYSRAAPLTNLFATNA